MIEEEIASYRQARYTISKPNVADQAKEVIWKHLPEGTCLLGPTFEVLYANQQIYSILQIESSNEWAA